MHAQPPTYIVLHMLKSIHTVWIVTQNVSRLRMRICSETHSISWHNKEFAQVVSQNYCWRSTQLHHVVTFLDVSRFAAFCSPYSIQFAFDQSSTRFQISPTRFQISPEFGYLTPFDLTPWPLAFRFHRLNRLGSFSTNSAAAATAETAESFPKILVRLLLLLTVLQRANPSGCSSSCILHDVFHH